MIISFVKQVRFVCNIHISIIAQKKREVYMIKVKLPQRERRRRTQEAKKIAAKRTPHKVNVLLKINQRSNISSLFGKHNAKRNAFVQYIRIRFGSKTNQQTVYGLLDCAKSINLMWIAWQKSAKRFWFLITWQYADNKLCV